jgi:chromosome segregation ATPase
MPSIYNPNKSNRSPSGVLDKEKVIEENKQLKSTLNNLNKELTVFKSQVHKKEKEISHKNKFIQDIYTDTHTNLLKSRNETKLLQKLRDNNLLSNIKKQYSDLKKEYSKKEIELETIKRTLKSTRLKEVQGEIQIYMDELQKLKSLYDISSQHNIHYETLLQENNTLQDNLNKQEMIIINLRQDLKEAEKKILNMHDRQVLSKKEIKDYEKMDNRQLIKEIK